MLEIGSGASRVFRSCGWCLLCCEFLFYASAIAHSAFRDQPRRRRPRPNENCPLRIRWASSTPAIVIAAFANDLNPAIDAQRRLMARWSCSMRLLRYYATRGRLESCPHDSGGGRPRYRADLRARNKKEPDKQ